MKIVRTLILITGMLVLVSCSGSKEYTKASDRPKQEKQFKDLFGFTPPASVIEIKYKDVYNRYLMNGAWGRWISFTYDEDVLSRIITENGFRTQQVHYTRQSVAPDWIIPVDYEQDKMFFRNQDDTEKDEGFYFKEYMWLKETTNMVYLYKYYSG